VDAALAAEARALHARCTPVDLHLDTFLLERLFGYDVRRRHRAPLPFAALGGHADVPRLREGGLALAVFGVVVAYWGSAAARRAAARSFLARFRRQADDPDSGLAFADDTASVEAARSRGRVGACLGLEGVHALGGDLSMLAQCREAGVRLVGLSHFVSNEAARCAIGPGASRSEGLSGFGRELVAECGRLGMTVDLAHVGRACFLEAARAATAPMVVSHTGVAALQPSDRNVDDAMIRAVADTGGTVGIIFTPQWLGGGVRASAERIVHHAEHVRDLVGADHVSLGSDFDGFVLSLPRDLRGAQDYPVVAAHMLRRGWRPDDIAKALGGNALRVLDAAKGKAAGGVLSGAAG